MTTYSQSDLATRALRKSHVGIDETPTAAELADAIELIGSETAALAIEGITIVNGSDEAVPQEHLEPLAAYYAITIKEDNGLIDEVKAEQTRQLMRARLRRLCAKPATGSVAEAEYY